MNKLSITIQRDSVIERYLSQFPHTYPVTDSSSESVCFGYGGILPPLAKISELLAMFQPAEYTISKSYTGYSFIVWSKD